MRHHGWAVTSSSHAAAIHHRRTTTTVVAATAIGATTRPRDVLALGGVGPVRLQGHGQGRQARQHGGEQVSAVGVDPRAQGIALALDQEPHHGVTAHHVDELHGSGHTRRPRDVGPDLAQSQEWLAHPQRRTLGQHVLQNDEAPVLDVLADLGLVAAEGADHDARVVAHARDDEPLQGIQLQRLQQLDARGQEEGALDVSADLVEADGGTGPLLLGEEQSDVVPPLVQPHALLTTITTTITIQQSQGRG